MRAFAHERFLQLHGQPGARLCRDQSIHGDTSAEQSVLFRCLNLVMFNTPMTHVTMLRSISVDRLVNLSAWSGALSKLAAQWKDATLYSALLLNGNLALLTVGVGGRIAAGVQQTCYISVVISITSTMTGVLLSQHAQRKQNVSASRSPTAVLN